MMSEIDCDKCRWQNNCQNDCVGYEPKKEKTNDDWRKTCSAEEFAKWLSDVMYACMRCGKSDGESVCHIRQCILDEEEAVEWLKEKHTDANT